jgi:hypothetical protein
VHHLSTRADCHHFTHGIHINAEKIHSQRRSKTNRPTKYALICSIKLIPRRCS